MSNSRARELLEEWGPFEEEPIPLFLDDFVSDPELQVRAKLDKQTVERYKQIYKQANYDLSEPPFPPIKVAEIDGVKFLLDGFHRTEAARLAGTTFVNAVVHTMSRKEALYEAAIANRSHGLPLRTKEYREVFKRYVGAGHHRSQEKRKRYKSYRTMAAELGGIPFTTIRNWMEQDFPSVFKAIGEKKSPKPVDLENRVDQEAKLAEAAAGALREAMNVMNGINDPEKRAHLRSLVSSIEVMVADWPMEPDPLEGLSSKQPGFDEVTDF